MRINLNGSVPGWPTSTFKSMTAFMKRNSNPNTQSRRQLFGVSLEKLITDDHAHLKTETKDVGAIPLVLELLVTQLTLEVNLKTEGIMRLSGNVKQARDIRSALEKGLTLNMEDMDGEAIHAVAILLKQFIRELPNGLVPAEMVEKFLSAESDIDKLEDAVDGLPDSNYYVLRYILLFIHRVADYSSFNKMTLNNLALIFAPTIFGSLSSDEDSATPHDLSLQQSIQASKALLALLNNIQRLFLDVESLTNQEKQIASPQFVSAKIYSDGNVTDEAKGPALPPKSEHDNEHNVLSPNYVHQSVIDELKRQFDAKNSTEAVKEVLFDESSKLSRSSSKSLPLTGPVENVQTIKPDEIANERVSNHSIDTSMTSISQVPKSIMKASSRSSIESNSPSKQVRFDIQESALGISSDSEISDVETRAEIPIEPRNVQNKKSDITPIQLGGAVIKPEITERPLPSPIALNSADKTAIKYNTKIDIISHKLDSQIDKIEKLELVLKSPLQDNMVEGRISNTFGFNLHQSTSPGSTVATECEANSLVDRYIASTPPRAIEKVEATIPEVAANEQKNSAEFKANVPSVPSIKQNRRVKRSSNLETKFTSLNSVDEESTHSSSNSKNSSTKSLAKTNIRGSSDLKKSTSKDLLKIDTVHIPQNRSMLSPDSSSPEVLPELNPIEIPMSGPEGLSENEALAFLKELYQTRKALLAHKEFLSSIKSLVLDQDDPEYGLKVAFYKSHLETYRKVACSYRKAKSVLNVPALQSTTLQRTSASTISSTPSSKDNEALNEERRLLKREIHRLKNLLKHLANSPSSLEVARLMSETREMLKSYYSRYRTHSQTSAASDISQDIYVCPVTPTIAEETDTVTHQLHQEKRSLQKQLLAFKKEFMEKNGRSPTSISDYEEVQPIYLRYKYLKDRIK